MVAVNASLNSYSTVDEPPIYDPMVKSSMLVSDLWSSWISNFVQDVNNYVNQNGVFLPQLTTDQIAALINPIGGQTVYNTTENLPQIFIITSLDPYQGEWMTFTVT